MNVFVALALLTACNKQPETISVTGITLNPTSYELIEGESVTITATVSPSDAANKNVQWSSSNPDIQVSNGKVTASFKPGAATTAVNGREMLGKGTITAKTEDGGKTATCEITVFAKTIAVTGISMSEDCLFLTKGQSYTLKATVVPDNATNKTVQWTTSDASVATVDQNGTVNAISSGNATITASAGDKSATCAVSVIIPVTSITLNKTSLTLEKGSYEVLTATVSPQNATNKEVKWTSSDDAVASVDNGVVTAHKAGDATITASVADFSATCKVSVIVPVTSISLSSLELTMKVGETALLEATILPEDATDKTIVWDSSDTNIATVDGGRITAVGFGTVFISAQAGYQVETCVVTVLTDSPEGVTAKYLGGDFTAVNGFIPSGSIDFSVTNMSTETITVKTVRLFDGMIEGEAEDKTLNIDIAPGTSHEWSFDIPAGGLNYPVALFTYTYRGEEYTCFAQYKEVQIKSKRRP
ncbi:MAG: Ig domain-containing protein [Bacteroidales bacterium]|nr:Ig domain-containing protein [Bacteroidales bacterium]